MGLPKPGRVFWKKWACCLAIYAPLAVLDYVLFQHASASVVWSTLAFIVITASWSGDRIQRRYWP